MKIRNLPKTLRFGVVAIASMTLVGCASVDFDQTLRDTTQNNQSLVGGQLELSQTSQQRESRRKVSEQLLSQPLGMNDAVQLALANSATIQTMLAQSWADMAAVNQSGRISNPVLTLARTRFKDELEFDRLLSFGLLDILTLPKRRDISRNQMAQAEVQLSANVVDTVAQVRQAWVRAVAAQQSSVYAEQVNKAAQASAELAKRMYQVGNFNKLQRARQQVFYADSAAQLALALHTATAAKEELVRQLGLDDGQAAMLTLADRLPDLPAQPRAATELSASAMQQRLDVQMARHQLDGAGKAQGLNLLSRMVDVELGVRQDTVFDNSTGQRANRDGVELGIRLPIFDWGGAQRAAMNAQTLVAVNRLETVTRSASSQLRESYSQYRTAYDLARHYRDEIVPLRKSIAEENVLRYNGMLIGVFELLADTREQINSVVASINAQQQFWLADVSLSSSLMGKPMGRGMTALTMQTSNAMEGAAH